ncbi:MAG: hypothetical protein WED00_03605 [Aquisalimonadaceae bacterium]
MKQYVTGMKQREDGVEISLGEGIEREKMDVLAAKCGPGGSGCDSDCCEPEFTSRVEGIDVSGVDDNITMHLRGAVHVNEVADKMSRCDCYDEV